MANIVLIGMELTDSLSLRYLTPLLSKKGHVTKIISFDSPSKVKQVVRHSLSLKPDLIGLSMIFSHRAGEFIELAHHLRAKGYRGHITAGGFFAHFNAHRLLRDYNSFDSVVYGEGELTIADLVDHLDNPEVVQGICLRAGPDTIDTPRRLPVMELDCLPFPDHQLPPRLFLNIGESNILSSRGCWANCHFCSINAWLKDIGAPRIRRRSARNVAEEIASLYHEHGARVFYFVDDNFLVSNKQFNLKHLGDLHSEFRRAGLDDIAIAVKCRPDCVDQDVFDLLMEMGLIRVFLGIESFSNDALQRLGKRAFVDSNVCALEILHRYDIHITYNILMFTPDSVLQEVLENLELIERFAMIPMNFARTEVYQGTALEKQLQKSNRLRGDCFSYDYTISDPLTQALFQIVAQSFAGRNFGNKRLNELAMQLDYGMRILRRFHADLVPARLDAEVDAFIRILNINSVNHLRDMAQELQKKPEIGDREISLFARDAYRCIERDNARLWKTGMRLWQTMVAIPHTCQRLTNARARTNHRISLRHVPGFIGKLIGGLHLVEEDRLPRLLSPLRSLITAYESLSGDSSILIYMSDMMPDRGFSGFPGFPDYSKPNGPRWWWWVLIIGAVVVVLYFILR